MLFVKLSKMTKGSDDAYEAIAIARLKKQTQKKKSLVLGCDPLASCQEEQTYRLPRKCGIRNATTGANQEIDTSKHRGTNQTLAENPTHRPFQEAQTYGLPRESGARSDTTGENLEANTNKHQRATAKKH